MSKDTAAKKKKELKLTLPEEEIMSPGHLACQGCGASMALRYALKALGRKTIMSIPACCWAVIDGILQQECLFIIRHLRQRLQLHPGSVMHSHSLVRTM